MIDQHTDEGFLQQAFDSNTHLKKDYSLGNIKTYRDIPGWINDAEWIYAKIVDECVDGDEVLEIGTFFGQSAARMCELIRNSGKDIKFYSMDIYYEAETALALGRHPDSFIEFRKAHDYTDMFNLVSNILTFMGLRKYVELICCDSKYGHRLFKNEQFKMVYVDGNHFYENLLADLNNFWPKVKEGGYLICDDTVYETVSRGINDFIKEKGINIDNVEFGNNCCLIKKI